MAALPRLPRRRARSPDGERSAVERAVDGALTRARRSSGPSSTGLESVSRPAAVASRQGSASEQPCARPQPAVREHLVRPLALFI